LSAPRSQRLFDALFTTEKMRNVFSDRARLQGMLDFEAALARAEARAGMISSAAAKAIAAQCRADLFDVSALASATALAGNPAIPLVRELTARVTSSDTEDALAGRTWLQQGPPVTLGLKAATWLSALERHRERVIRTRRSVATLQFGGAVGTLAALGDQGANVAEALALELDLALPDLPWHAQRDRVCEVATTLGLLTGTLGTIARDVSLLMQTEIAEALEPGAPGRGGSSTMPHKRNPVGSAVILAAAVRVPPLVATMLAAMVQEHERGLGGWHAEWETLPEICMLTAGALARAIEIVEGLQVDPQKMAADLEITHGLVMAEAVSMALAKYLGRQSAHELVEKACALAAREKRHLREVLAADARVTKHLSKAELDRVLDPAGYTGQAAAFVSRVLASRGREKAMKRT